jgi:hypothetical protein
MRLELSAFIELDLDEIAEHIALPASTRHLYPGNLQGSDSGDQIRNLELSPRLDFSYNELIV